MAKIVNAEMMSAIKRKNVKDMLELMLAFDGNEEGAELVSKAGRLTDKLYKDAGCYAEDECRTFEEPLPEFAEAAVEAAQEAIDQLKDLDTLIAKGKKKKAKKLLKAIEDTGAKGSEITRRKQLIKGLKDGK